MCNALADGGKRCYGCCRKRVERIERRLEKMDQDDPKREQVEEDLANARQEMRETRTGLQNHIAEHVDGKAYDADELTATFNGFLDGSERGKDIELPGGKFRVKGAYTSHGHTILEVTGPKAAQSYSAGVSQCYNKNAFGKQVTLTSEKELRQDFTHMLVTVDGRAGAAVKKSGEIAAVYSNTERPRATQALLPLAVQRGGTHLECFDTFLPKIYGRSGFIPVATIPFSREFAPDGWDYREMKKVAPPHGEPNIVFMAHEDHHRKIGSPSLRHFEDYDDAETYTREGENR